VVFQIFLTLSFAAYWGETFLPSASSSVLLCYEILHADAVLDSLSDLLGISTVAASPEEQVRTPLPNNPRETPQRSLFFPISPRRTQFGLPRDGPPSFLATECVSNIRCTISFFKAKIEDFRNASASEDEVDAEAVMAIIERHLGELELIDAAAMGDLRRYHEGGEHEAFFRGFSSYACEDILALLPTTE
jgi:hypothetical protein